MRSNQIDAYNSIVEIVLAKNGCIQYDLKSVKGNENQFVLLEKWASKEALVAHDVTAHMVAADADSLAYRAKPAKVLELQPI